MRNRAKIQRPILTTLFSILGILFTAHSHAGVGDSPLPDYPAKAKHFFTIPGVVKSGSQETIFRCTIVKFKNNIVPATVSVEIFDSVGTKLSQANVGSSSVGATLAIGTGTVASEINTYFNGLSWFKGSARIISNAKRLLCDAYVTDKNNNPPVSMRSLPVIKKNVQSGD